MTFLKHFYKTVFKYDLINKFNYKTTKNLPKLKKIILNFGCKNAKLKNLATSFLALELISCKKGTLTKTKKSNLFLKIRKGNPVGCKVILNNKQMFNFLERNLNEILPKKKNLKPQNFSTLIDQNWFSYEIYNKFYFIELEKQYYLFNELPKLDITLVTDLNLKKELIFIINSFKLY